MSAEKTANPGDELWKIRPATEPTPVQNLRLLQMNNALPQGADHGFRAILNAKFGEEFPQVKLDGGFRKRQCRRPATPPPQTGCSSSVGLRAISQLAKKRFIRRVLWGVHPIAVGVGGGKT
jgi:hypothetical protein